MEIPRRVKKIIFANSPRQAKQFLNYAAKYKKSGDFDYLFIAMNPKTHSYLKKKGFVVHNTLPYFTNESHMEALEKSEAVMDWLRKNSEFIDPGTGNPHSYRDLFILWTRPAVIYCLWTIEVVLNAVEMHRPEMLLASISERRAVSSPFLEPEEKYLGIIVKTVAEKKGIDYENIPANEIFSRILPFKLYIYSMAKFIIRYVKFQIWQNVLSLKFRIGKKRFIVFSTRFYNMRKLAEEVKDKFLDEEILFMEEAVIPSFEVSDIIARLLYGKSSKTAFLQKKSLSALVEAIEKNLLLFSFKDIPFAEIVSQKIKTNIAAYIIGLYLWSIKLNQFANALRPLALVSSGNRIDDLILAGIYNKKAVPTILISHGSLVRPKNKYELIEWTEQGRVLLDAPFSYLASQSPLAEEYFDDFQSSGRVIKTGPIVWGRQINAEASKALFRRMFNGKYDFRKIKIILHAGTPKATKALRLYVYETSDEYIQSLTELANAVEGIPDTVLIIKFRPSFEISAKVLRQFISFSEKVILSVDEPFLDLLGISDLLISFSSTTIEEALQNKIPVLLYGGAGRYQHVPAYEIKLDDSIQPSAVYHVKEARNLENALCKILDSDKKEHLFNPYVYAQDSRTPFIDLLRSMYEKKKKGFLNEAYTYGL